jgi:two-component system, sensor histidine kinase and response regulator
MKTILVVEDNQDIREEVRDILIMENFMVYEALDGYDGLQVSREILPDLIISDISMPLIDGYEFLSELKKNTKTESIPLIFLSAKSEMKDFRIGMNLGADDYLTKPLCPDDLIIAVNKKLELKSINEKKLQKLISQIIDYMPHELITPLNGILGLSEYLGENIDIPKDELKKIANCIHNSGERLNNLIQNYLIYSGLLVEFNSPQKGFDTGDINILSPDELIKKFTNAIEENRKKDLILLLEPLYFKFSNFAFTKIFEELFNNALKFSKEGSKIIVSSTIENGIYILQVENFGSGISQDQIDQIGAFVQFNRKVIEQQGLGLGLEIVKLITELNNGIMVINSRLDEYFKVSCQIPVS